MLATAKIPYAELLEAFGLSTTGGDFFCWDHCRLQQIQTIDSPKRVYLPRETQIVAEHNLNQNVNQSPARESHRKDVDLSVICLLVSQRGGHLQVNDTSPTGTSLTIF